MRRQSTVRQLQEVIKPFGLRVVEGAHRKILNRAGKVVYSFSGSPSCQFFAQNTLYDLVRMGLVPAALKRQKIRG